MKSLSYRNTVSVSALPAASDALKGVLVRLTTDDKPYWCNGAVWIDLSAIDTGVVKVNYGSTTLDFGTGSNQASAVITGLTAITLSSEPRAYINASDASVDHSPKDHRYLGIFANLSCGDVLNEIGFTIYATSKQKLTGKWTIRYSY